MKSKKNLTRFTYQTTALQGWRLCIARGEKSFTRYFPDKQCCGERGALKAAEAKLAELQGFLDSTQRKAGKLIRAAEAGARQVLKAVELRGSHSGLRPRMILTCSSPRQWQPPIESAWYRGPEGYAPRQ